MKNIFKGFTLAEILICLGVVGVVAAITIPTLASRMERAQIGPSLAKAINTLENLNVNVIERANARNLIDACGTTYLNCLATNLEGGVVSSSHYSGGGYGNGFKTKDNITFYLRQDGAIEKTPISPRFGTSAYEIFVDIDGPEKGSNTLSQDLFLLIIDTTTGDVFAYGSDELSKAYSNYENVGWTAGRCDSTGISAPIVCAGSIVDNDYKVIY